MLKIKSAIATTTTTTKTATTTNREHKSSAARSAAAARPCLSTYFLHFAFFFLSFLLSLTFFVCLLPARILAKCRLRQSSRYRRRRWRRCGHRNRFLFFFCLLLLLLFFCYSSARTGRIARATGSVRCLIKWRESVLLHVYVCASLSLSHNWTCSRPLTDSWDKWLSIKKKTIHTCLCCCCCYWFALLWFCCTQRPMIRLWLTPISKRFYRVEIRIMSNILRAASKFPLGFLTAPQLR